MINCLRISSDPTQTWLHKYTSNHIEKDIHTYVKPIKPPLIKLDVGILYCSWGERNKLLEIIKVVKWIKNIKLLGFH